jgi:cytochrome c oxidase cbb3-type subunit 3
MPAFGRDGILTADQIVDVVSHVRLISHQERMSASARRGAALFAVNCAACHGPEGKGDRQFGAPNLTDGIWLYGGDRATIVQTVTNARYGVMPAWGEKLDPVTIKMLAVYVHGLGGGEASPQPAPTQPGPAQEAHGAH